MSQTPQSVSKISKVESSLNDVLTDDAKKAYDNWTNKRYQK
ncbi:MAG TPA: hypothetical protein VJ571_06020 [Candidatus Nitrosotalea sp.]|nr:hypothetical protein [Candidatus Nitrosotalea sp.]